MPMWECVPAGVSSAGMNWDGRGRREDYLRFGACVPTGYGGITAFGGFWAGKSGKIGEMMHSGAVCDSVRPGASARITSTFRTAKIRIENRNESGPWSAQGMSGSRISPHALVTKLAGDAAGWSAPSRPIASDAEK